MKAKQEFKMSQARFDELQKELNYLKTTRSDEVAEQIKVARGFGDLSENSEYDEAKNEQGKLYSRIAEVENILLEHKAVLECSVVGVPDELRGQAIKAIVVLAPGYQASHELELELREFCNSRLADYKWVRIIEFVPELPKTISGKVRRAVLRER